MSPDDLFIIGTGRTPFTSDPASSVKQLAAIAIAMALSDAGVGKSDIAAAFFSNAGQGALGGQHMIRGQIALRDFGFEQIPVINVENACASATTALLQALTTLRAGDADVVLAVGAERLSTGNPAAEKAFFSGATDVETPLPYSDASQRRSVFMDMYAKLAREHMSRFGTPREAFAAVASKNLTHACWNPDAQRRQPMSVEQVLAAREVVWPLTLPMCAPIGNGAAAAIVCNRDALSRFPDAHPVRVLAGVLGSGSLSAEVAAAVPITRRLSSRAYELAGLGPRDMGVAEVHDATAAGEIIQIEALGLVPEGEGGAATLRGETTIGGRIPVNVSGGLECNGHPIGATGLAQVHEVANQLRGRAGARQVENASFGLVENGGGFLCCEEAVASVLILGRAGGS